MGSLWLVLAISIIFAAPSLFLPDAVAQNAVAQNAVAQNAVAQNAVAQKAEGDAEAKGQTKDTFWLLSLNGSSPLGDSPLGISAGIHVGMGSFYHRGFYEVGLDILSGPYQRSAGDGLGTDYNGTGISGQVGWHIAPGRFRYEKYSGGLVLGLGYSDVTGTSFAKSSSGEVTRQSLRVIRYLVEPGLYVGLWQPPRLDGNAARLLDTRIESAILSISLSLPMSHHWQGHIGSNGQPHPPAKQAASEHSDDPLDRAFLKVSLQVFLGV